MQPNRSAPTLLQGATAQILARALSMLLALLVMVVVARLGPQVQGVFALFLAAEGLLATLATGAGLLLAREASAASGSPPPWTRTLMAGVAGAGIVVGAVFFGVSRLSDAAPYTHLWMLGLAAPVLLLLPTVSGLWLGQGRIGLLNAPTIVAPAAVLAALALLQVAGSSAPGVVAVLAVWVVAKATIGLWAGVTVWRDAGLRRSPSIVPDPPAVQRSLWTDRTRFIAVVAITNAISLLNLRLTLFILERYQGLESAGVYAVAVQIAELLWVLSGAWAVAAYHRLSGQEDQAIAVTLRALRAGLAWVGVAALPLALLGWWGLPWALGPAYAAARLPLLLLLPGVIAYAAASSLSAFHTNFHGRPQWSARVAGVSLTATLGLALVMVPLYGAAGAAVSTSVGYTLAMAMALRSFVRPLGGWSVLWRHSGAL